MIHNLIIIAFSKDPLVFLLLINLIILHLWLKSKNLTTYEHIMNKRKMLEINRGKKNVNFKLK